MKKSGREQDQRAHGNASRRGHRRALLAVATFVITGSFASSAGAYVYYGRDHGTQIERASLDGTQIKQDFITGANSPTGIAVDSAHIYWVNRAGNTIGRANLDGTSVQQDFITGASGPLSVAVDASHIYWTNRDGGFGGGSIGRADISGNPASVNQTFIGAANPTGVAVDAGHVYWSDSFKQAIYRANLDGTIPARYIDTTYPNGDPGYAQAVSVNANYVYWTTANGSQDGVISRATKVDSPGAPERLATGQRIPVGLALDAQFVYWADSYPGQPPTDGTILRANFDGSNATRLISESTAVSYVGANGIAVDALGPSGSGTGGVAPGGGPPSAPPDRTPPQTSITKHPKAKITTKHSSVKVSFSFKSSEAHSAFKCKLDKGSFKSCGSPKSYKVKPGKHTFQVYATDKAGNRDRTPAKFAFKVIRKK